MLRRTLPALVLIALVAPAAARAADPGRWTETGRSTVPLYYYQGTTADPAKRLFFNGVYTGLYRTDSNLNEKARNDDVIPPQVHLAEQYNHIGDIDWDAREGGRILLPMECYYPRAAPDNTEDPNNTCRTGSIGVADPDTLQWRYYVKLDPAEIPKVMWCEVSPDGELLWTQSRNDLLAYDMDDIKAANAAPLGPKVKAVKRLVNARPPSGITGATFIGDRMYVAGQDQGPFQVWSIDLTTGQRRLEIEREVVGESEGVVSVEALGGTLHWLIQPYNQESVPTYGVLNGTLLHFVPKGEKPTTPVQRPAKIHLQASPTELEAGERQRMYFVARAKVAGRLTRMRGVKVELGGRSELTDKHGRAFFSVRIHTRGTHRARASREDLRPGKANIHVQ